jgi:hypothetical protein
MSLVKAKLKEKDILDFSAGKISKRGVRQALRQAEILEFDDSNGLCLIDNWITVGMYRIRISPIMSFDRKPKTRLKDFGNFGIEIDERGQYGKHIDFKKDVRFKSQSWTTAARNYQFRTENLIDVILHCSRLNKLRAFN